MSRITTYAVVSSLAANDVFIIDGPNGTKTITANNASEALVERFCAKNPYNRRNVYRPLNLGTSFTAEQQAALSGSNPTFAGLYIGSYWTINGHRYTIADFDYWFNKYDKIASATETSTQAENNHHVVLIADFGTSQKMNDTNTTEGAYLGSKMYTENLSEHRTAVAADWGDHVMTHRESFSNAVTDGVPSAHEWVDSTVDLMNECMVYGGYRHSPFPANVINHDHYTVDRDQLALFRLKPDYLGRVGFWLRDVVSASCFALANGTGYAGASTASYATYVRSAFAIKA